MSSRANCGASGTISACCRPSITYPQDHQRLWFYIGIFPSMVLAIYPDSMEFYMTIPLAAGSTRLIGGAYALPDDRREVRAARYLGARINRVTNPRRR